MIRLVATSFIGLVLGFNALFGQVEVNPNVIIPILNTSGLAVFLYGFWQEWWVTGTIYRRRVEETAELKAENREKTAEIARLNAYFQDTVIPAIIRFTDREVERMRHHPHDGGS